MAPGAGLEVVGLGRREAEVARAELDLPPPRRAARRRARAKGGGRGGRGGRGGDLAVGEAELAEDGLGVPRELFERC